MSGFILTDENYYSREADMAFMSCSQYQGFLECEAKAVAKLDGRWVEQEKEAFLVGNYFHSFFEGKDAHQRFCDDNLESVFKTRTDKKTGVVTITGKYAPYIVADKMIAAVLSDPMMKQFVDLPGETEQFMTGTVFGVPWRMKMDKYVPGDRYILDYKTTANIWDTAFDPARGRRVSFVEHYGYVFRAAVYSMIEMQNVFDVSFDEAFANLSALSDLPLPQFLLLCVSKQDYPDKEIIRVNNKQAYIYELETLRKKLGRVEDLKARRILPKRCGVCDYCRATKQVTRIKSFYELSPEFRSARNEREDDYHASFEHRAEVQASPELQSVSEM